LGDIQREDLTRETSTKRGLVLQRACRRLGGEGGFAFLTMGEQISSVLLSAEIRRFLKERGDETWKENLKKSSGLYR